MLVVLAITWVLLPAVIGKYVGGHYALVWLMSSGVGIMAGQYPTYRRVLAQRAATKAEYGDRPQLLIDGTHTPGDLHTAHTAVQALDGHTQTIVSVLRGTARLDIGGNAATNQLLVYANATSNAATPPTSPPALTALDSFWHHGTRNPGLNWTHDPDTADRRPPSLQATD